MFIREIFLELLKLFNKITLRPSKEIKKVINIYEEMQKLIEETDAERVLVFKAHNGGGLIRPTTPLYASVLYEDYTHPFRSVKTEYQKIELDQSFLRTLSETCENKSLLMDTKNLPNGILKDIYLAEGVTLSEIHYLCQDKKNLYYCSIATSKKQLLVSAKEKLLAKLVVNNIKNNII